VRTSVHRLTAVAVALVIILAGCSDSSRADRTEAPVPTASSALPATTSPALSLTVPSPSAMSPSPSTGLLSWTYVALGDSWPAGGHCGGCRPFPVLYRDGLAASTGRRIDFVDFTDAGTAKSLLQDVRTSVTVRDAIRRGDIVMISTGGNDLEPAFVAASAGTCGGEDQLDCFRDAAASMRASFDGVVTEIELLRNGRPTAIQLVTGVNEFLTDPDLIDAVGPAYAKTHGVAITKMLAEVQCEVAAKHPATTKCIDLGLALNGPDLLKPVDSNTQASMQDVADVLLASGLPELP
jgi:hypothetical protein